MFLTETAYELLVDLDCMRHPLGSAVWETVCTWAMVRWVRVLAVCCLILADQGRHQCDSGRTFSFIIWKSGLCFMHFIDLNSGDQIHCSHTLIVLKATCSFESFETVCSW
jgi:hypothetical protein